MCGGVMVVVVIVMLAVVVGHVVCVVSACLSDSFLRLIFLSFPFPSVRLRRMFCNFICSGRISFRFHTPFYLLWVRVRVRVRVRGLQH
jgi:hypothetical protein